MTRYVNKDGKEWLSHRDTFLQLLIDKEGSDLKQDCMAAPTAKQQSTDVLKHIYKRVKHNHKYKWTHTIRHKNTNIKALRTTHKSTRPMGNYFQLRVAICYLIANGVVFHITCTCAQPSHSSGKEEVSKIADLLYTVFFSL